MVNNHISLKEAIAEHVHDGDAVALEGFTHLIPHAAGHELVRQGRRDLTLYRMTPDVVYDQLIGMGAAKRVVFSWGGNPGVGSLHRLRDAVERSHPHPIEIEERSHADIANAYVAGASGLQFGLVASTDTHLGAAGLTVERGHPGHGGAGKPARDALPVGLPDDLGYNPGGLAVLWAEENTRESLFAAMQRREAYGTSGTRPTLRFFAGAGIDEASCDADDPAAAGYAGGVPMGGVLDAAAAAHPPRFLVSGLRDPHPSAAPLDRIEIVKGWRDGDALQERVVRLVGGHDASVDTNSCERRGEGAEALCTVWMDPDFDPTADAFYYARLLETPSCRWSQWACLDAGVDCSDPSTIGEGFEACCAEDHVKTIQERAWSSPIWIEP